MSALQKIQDCDSVENSRSSRMAVPSASASFSLPSRTFVKTIVKLFAKLILKLWRWASSFVAIIFFLAWFYGGILPYAVGFIAIMSLTYHLCDTLLYQPEIPVESRLFIPSPASYGLPFESLEIHTQDRVKLHAYLLKQQNSRNGATLIYFHGNAGNIGHRLDNSKGLFTKLTCNILLLEYRGYGHSEGYPSEEGFYLDAQAAYDFVYNREDLDSSKIILFGRSLGGAVAIDLASRCDYRDRIRALIVENTFTSIPDLAKVLFPVGVIRWIPRIFFKNRFESSRKVSSVVCPTLLLSGLKDELIPPKHMDELFKRCSSNMKKMSRFPEGSHNDTWHCKDYMPRLSEFIKEVLSITKEMKYDPYSDNVV
ncbi:unnamed protein product [Allacma fusca]|uniref:Protein ABHD13 n=1 Tax=Allacma fusca TaxID=39272 RepID=A0A8J2ME46_9HEXA|nr:unnamed protein product [Allacma fusca]